MSPRHHRSRAAFTAGVALFVSLLSQGSYAQLRRNTANPSDALAIDRLNEPGPEGEAIGHRTGLWDVTETVWASPKSLAVAASGLVAERHMVGSLLQETIRSARFPASTVIKRIDLLSYNRVEGRWEYVSFDTRAPVGLMPAWSSDRGNGSTIELSFAPLAFVGTGSEVTGQMLRIEQIIRFEDTDHDVKDQYFTMADGSGTKWLAHRYAYARHK